LRHMSLQSALAAGLLSWLLIGFFAVSGRFGPSTGGALMAAAAEAMMIGAALAAAHCICGIVIGSRIEEGSYGLISVFLMATAFTAFVLLVLKCFVILLFLTGGPNRIPHDVELGVAMTCISWGSWFAVYRVELRRRLRDEWAGAKGQR
jgi:hypothetical protein